MNQQILHSLLACPRCQAKLTIKTTSALCRKCDYEGYLINSIWNLVHTKNKETVISQQKYEKMYQSDFDGPPDGSYELLAAFAKGNRSIDIACGSGSLLTHAPDTVGVDFSFNALKQARKRGLRFLIQADAHALPFINDAFEVAISSGNLEHFADPLLTLKEMARVSKMQCMIIHKYPPLPLAKQLFPLITRIFKVSHQPIEKPLTMHEIERLAKFAGLHIVFKGVWTLPFNYGRVIKYLPQFDRVASAYFLMSVKNK